MKSLKRHVVSDSLTVAPLSAVRSFQPTLSIMTKYRIKMVYNGVCTKYYPQKRVLLFFWKTLKTHHGVIAICKELTDAEIIIAQNKRACTRIVWEGC